MMAVGATLRGGRLSRAAVAATAIAVASTVGATGLTASYDRLLAEPSRFGAWWDVAVGQYSEADQLADGVERLRANRAAVAVAGFADELEVGMIDGRHVPLLASVDYVGSPTPVMVAGRPPASPDEVAVGRATAEELRKGIGDEVTMTGDGDTALRMRVVGIAVINDPIAVDTGEPGRGALIRMDALSTLRGRTVVSQSLAVRLDPQADRGDAIESVRADFPGSIREAIPQVDVRNLGRLRPVPLLIAGLVGLLALATLAHALASSFARHVATLTVLGALGFTRGQQRAVRLSAGLALAAGGVVLGVPLGLALGARIWSSVLEGIDLVGTSELGWAGAAAAALGALAVAGGVSLVASRSRPHAAAGEARRVE